MSKIRVFDPAMCCSTGVCGPAIDPVLPQFAADLEWVQSKGVEVERYNLAQQVVEFTANALVKQALNSKGTKCLPLILVDGAVKSEGSYPTREQLATFASIPYEPGPKVKVRGGDLVGIGNVGVTK